MNLVEALTVIQREGLAKELSETELRDICQSIFDAGPETVEASDNELLQILTDFYQSDESLRSARATNDGFIHHDWRFGQETDDIIKEFADIVGGETPILKQIAVETNAIMVQRYDGKKTRLDVSQSLPAIAEIFNETLVVQGGNKRFFPIETDGDSFAYFYLDRVCLSRISGVLSITDIDERPAPLSYSDSLKLAAQLQALIPALGNLDIFETSFENPEAPESLPSTKLKFLEMEIANLKSEMGDTTMFGDDRPRLLSLMIKRAKFLTYDGRTSEAIEQCTQAIDLSHSIPGEKFRFLEYESHLVCGIVHLAMEQANESIADFTRAIEIFPELPRAYKKRAQAFEKLGEHEKATADRLAFARNDERQYNAGREAFAKRKWQ